MYACTDADQQDAKRPIDTTTGQGDRDDETRSSEASTGRQPTSTYQHRPISVMNRLVNFVTAPGFQGCKAGRDAAGVELGVK